MFPAGARAAETTAILAAVQRLCRDEQLPPEKVVFVSGIGCSSRFPHYMKTYGFHGLHGRALPVAEGIKIRRPDLHVFVNMGDGDCCSIGAAHWIHAHPLQHEHDRQAFNHRGLSFIRVLQRCPEFLPTRFDPWLQDPDSLLVLTHEKAIRDTPSLAKTYPHREEHDPSDLNRARELVSITERIPVGILYRDADMACYEDLMKPQRVFTPEVIRAGLEAEFDKFTIAPAG